MALNASQIRHIATLHYENGNGNREIARTVSFAGPATVSRVLTEIEGCGIAYEELKKLSDDDFMATIRPATAVVYLEPDMEEIYEYWEKDRKAPLYAVITETYLAAQLPPGMKFYSTKYVMALFSRWLAENKGRRFVSQIPCLPGDFLEIDFSGDNFLWLPNRGDLHYLRIFVGVYRYSGLIFAKAYEDETTPSWLDGIISSFEYAEGVPKVVVLDNTTSLVVKPDRFQGEVNMAMSQLCNYYGTQFMPAHIKAPTHKSETERGCNIFQSVITPQLKKYNAGTFFVADSLDDVNLCIRKEVDAFNLRSFTDKSKGSRRSLFELHEKGALSPLPIMRFEVCKWVTLKADENYLVHFGNHRYMVHWSEAGKVVLVKISGTTLFFYDQKTHQLVGEHARDYSPEGKTHVKEEYMSEIDKAFRRGETGWREMFVKKGWGSEAVLRFIHDLAGSGDPAMLTYRRLTGLLGLCKHYGSRLVEQACLAVEKSGSKGDYLGVKKELGRITGEINQRRRARKSPPRATTSAGNQSGSTQQANIRGPEYYTQEGK